MTETAYAYAQGDPHRLRSIQQAEVVHAGPAPKRIVVPASGRIRIGVSTDAKRFHWTLGARSGKGSGRVLKLRAPAAAGTYRLTVSEHGHVDTASVVVR